jgi:hypothetical protein
VTSSNFDIVRVNFFKTRDSHLFLPSALGEKTLVPSSSSLIIFDLCHSRGAQRAQWTDAGARPRRGGARHGWRLPRRSLPGRSSHAAGAIPRLAELAAAEARREGEAEEEEEDEGNRVIFALGLRRKVELSPLD